MDIKKVEIIEDIKSEEGITMYAGSVFEVDNETADLYQGQWSCMAFTTNVSVKKEYCKPYLE